MLLTEKNNFSYGSRFVSFSLFDTINTKQNTLWDKRSVLNILTLNYTSMLYVIWDNIVQIQY